MTYVESKVVIFFLALDFLFCFSSFSSSAEVARPDHQTFDPAKERAGPVITKCKVQYQYWFIMQCVQYVQPDVPLHIHTYMWVCTLYTSVCFLFCHYFWLIIFKVTSYVLPF